MFRATQQIFNFLGLVCLAVACAGPQTKYEIDADAVESESLAVNTSLEKAWRAAQLALAEYPIRVNNQDSGIIETEPIRSDQGFRVPGRERQGAPSGRKYRIQVRIYRDHGTDDATRVVVRKTIETQKDFFSAAEKVASDGLEELAIMYRIERELNIEKAADQQSKEENRGLDI